MNVCNRSFFDSGTSVLLFGPTAFSTVVSVFQTYFGNLPGVGAGTIFSGTCLTAQQIGDVNAFPTITLAIQVRVVSSLTRDASVGEEWVGVCFPERRLAFECGGCSHGVRKRLYSTD